MSERDDGPFGIDYDGGPRTQSPPHPGGHMSGEIEWLREVVEGSGVTSPDGVRDAAAVLACGDALLAVVEAAAEARGTCPYCTAYGLHSRTYCPPCEVIRSAGGKRLDAALDTLRARVMEVREK